MCRKHDMHLYMSPWPQRTSVKLERNSPADGYALNRLNGFVSNGLFSANADSCGWLLGCASHYNCRQ